MISSLFGIAIVALPASTITSGMMDEIEHESKDNQEQVIKNRPRRPPRAI